MNTNACYTNLIWARKAMTILLGKMTLFEVLDRSVKGREFFGVYELGVKFYANGPGEWVTVWPTDENDLDEIRNMTY